MIMSIPERAFLDREAVYTIGTSTHYVWSGRHMSYNGQMYQVELTKIINWEVSGVTEWFRTENFFDESGGYPLIAEHPFVRYDGKALYTPALSYPAPESRLSRFLKRIKRFV